jgi:hypothetical protein
MSQILNLVSNPGAPGAEIKAKVFLFHAGINRNLRASVTYLAE